MSALLLAGQTAPLLGNPTGGAIVAGSATIGAAGPTLTINQSTQSAIINWQTFSIANGETTKFIVPNSGAATLNRVAAGNPSAIYGNLQSNGILYLVNPSGIVVGPNGRIDTAGFMASTLDVSNQQFLKGGDLNFAGSSDASIANAGTIHASMGDVYLIANQVSNTGTITAPQGNVGLAAGNEVLFQQAGNQHLFVQATPSGTKRATGVTNAGSIRAAAAELKAAGGNAYALAINNTGVIAATGYKKVNGQVYLTSDGGSISNSGKISAQQANGNGGTIALTGTSSTSTSTANTVTNSGTLDASATEAGGTGGTISVKNMTGATVHSGAIIAKGGQGGAGGNAEVSGHTVGFTGTVDLTAPGGKTGNLLLDPANLEVISTTGGGSIIGGQNDPTSTQISNTTVDDALSTANVTLNADQSITIDGFIQWLSGSTLTLSTNNVGSSITFNNSIGSFNGGGSVIIHTAGATDFVGGPGLVEISGSFILQSGAWFQGVADTTNGNLPIFAANDFQIQGSSSFIRVTNGDGSAGNPYLVADVYGLQGLAGSTYASANIKLVHNIDATSTPSWNGGQGFVPLAATASYLGTFNGQGFTIDGLFMQRPTVSAVGLFGELGSTGTISNLFLTNVSITGQSSVGALVGENNGGTISNIALSGTVAGNQTANVGDFIGGLVGANFSGSIDHIKSSINITGADDVGGLVGYNDGAITSATITGTVTASHSTDGGLVGYDDVGSTVTSSSNTGAVLGGGVNVGGLIGYNRGVVSTSYNSGSVESLTGSVGGLVGENDDINSAPALIQNSYSIGAVTGSGTNNTGGLVGDNFGTILDSYSSGAVSGSSITGGLVGANPGTVSGSFWDTTTSGQSTSSGGTGLATTALLSASTYTGAGWSIGTDLTSDTWVIFDGQTRPILAAAYSTTITDAHQLQLIGLNATTLAANYTLANNVDLSGTSNPADVWGTSQGNGSGFVPIGGGNNPYNGTFSGQGHTMDGLYINRPSTDEVGLFGYAQGTIQNLTLTNLNVTGNNIVGGLAGTIGNPSSGFQGTGILSFVTSNGNVTGNGSYVGGLIGLGHGTTISSAFSAGSVTGGSFTGGLVGSSLSTLNNTFSTMNVSGTSVVGGLVGENYNGGVINNSYSLGLVAGNSEVGAFVGRNLNVIQNSFYDTSFTGVRQGVGSGNSSSTLVGTTTAHLETQSYIETTDNTAPLWDFTNVWTTNGDTTTPQLLGLGISSSPPSGVTNDMLSGTAYIDGGATAAPLNTVINLISSGGLLGSTTTDSSGGFSFTINSTNLTSGILLTDPNDQGNTYYQANSPASTITGIDIWGSTLRIMADSANNAALKTAAGSLSGSGINYGVNGANVLSTTAGIDVNILASYAFDGNITAGGAFYTSANSVLTSSQAVTLTGSRSSLSGSLTSTAAVNLTSTSGDVVLINLGTSTPATAASMTLTSAGAVSMGNTDLTLSGGDFTATGHGSASDLNGIDLQGCNFITNGGNISLTGHSITQFNAQLGGLVAGEGIDIANSVLETIAHGQSTPTSGNITLNGNASPGAGVSVLNNLDGVAIDGTTLSVVNGAITITGTVSNGTTATYSNPVDIFNTSVVEATGTGSVSITGSSVGATASTNITGVRVDNASVLADGGNSGITITGTAGTLANATLNAGSVGIYAYTGARIVSSGPAPITLLGTGGTDSNTNLSLNTFSCGIFLSSQNSGVLSEVGTTSGALSLTGIGGISPRFSSGLNIYGPNGGTAEIDSTSGAITMDGSLVNVANPSTGLYGIDFQVGSEVSALSGNITIDGTAQHGAATSGTSPQADGVLMSQSTIQTTLGGAISITGDSSGMTGNYQFGGLLAYQSIISASGNLSITGTTATTSAVSDELYGINLRGATPVSSSGGTVTLTGTVGSGTAGMRDFGVRVSEGSTVSAPLSVTVNGSTAGSIGQGIDAGVVVEGAGSSVSGLGSASVTISGHSGALTGTTGSIIDIGGDNVYYNPGTYGVLVSDRGSVTSAGTAPVTLTGTSGTNANTDPTSSSAAISVFSPQAGQTTTLSAGGLLTLSGAPLVLGGANNLGNISITSNTGVLLSTPVGTTSTISAPITSALSLSGGAFVLDLANSTTLGTVSVSSLLIQAAGFGVDLGATTTAALTINGAGAITQSAPLNVSLLTINNAVSVTLTNASNVLSSLGAISSSGPINLFTDPGLTLTNTVTSGSAITIAETGGALTLAAGGQVIETGTATITLAAGTNLANSNYFINDSSAGANAVQPGSFGKFDLFSSDPTYDSFGGITFAPANMVYHAVYPTTASNFTGFGNAAFFYLAGAGQVGPNNPNAGPTVPNTMTGGAAGSGSNIVPPVLTVQTSQILPQTQGDGSTGRPTNFLPNGGADENGNPPPAFSFTGTGVSQLLGQLDGGLANSASNSGQVTSGDIAQLGNGQYNNVSNPQAADVLNEALGPIVYANLADALRALGDWADVPAAANDTAGADGETILTGGDVAEMTGTSAKKIPLSQAPEQLQNALKDDSLQSASH